MWFLSWTISSLQKKLAEVDIPTGFLQFSIKFFGLLILVSLLNLHQPPVKSFVADLTNSLQLNFRNSTIFWLGLTSLEPFSIKLHIVIIFLLLSFLIISLCMMICFLPLFFLWILPLLGYYSWNMKRHLFFAVSSTELTLWMIVLFVEYEKLLHLFFIYSFFVLYFLILCFFSFLY